ncbi:MAG: sigma 54-interacting transcriptional regulator [Polyangiales bacterium]
MTTPTQRHVGDSLHATAIESRDTTSPERRVLHVLGEVMKTYPLSEGRSLVLGRSSTADLVIDTPSVSRSHAALHVGKTLQLEDLGSANGTSVRGVALEPHKRVDVYPGDEIVLGKVPCVVQGRSRLAPAVVTRSLRTHEYFEARLADECARGEPFAVARVRVTGAVDSRLEAALLDALRPTEVAAWYGPGDYELLLPGAGDAGGRLASITAALGDAAARTSAAAFPRDGRTPDALIEATEEMLRGDAPDAPSASGDIVVEDPAMVSLHRLLGRVAAADVPVLLLGEMGTGKELFAAELHRRSPRASKPFRAINCASFTESLVEAELFGYEKGAFTGANAARPGILESAAGGTVFLDEVGELAPSVQARLLRVLEEQKVRRVGAVEERPIDVRFVAATNRDLDRAVADGGFRGDLFFRLNGFSLHIPALRERVGEIVPLAKRFLAMAAKKAGRAEAPTLSRDAVTLLLQHRWPGNIRELRNEMTRAVILTDGEVVTPEHLSVSKMRPTTRAPMAESTPPSGPPATGVEGVRTLAEVKAEAEKEHVRHVLALCHQNQTRAAELLGISRSQIVNLIERYNLPRPRGGA